MSEKYAAGIDVGGTSIKYAFADATGRVIYSSRLPVDGRTSAKQVIALIEEAIGDCKARAEAGQGYLVGAGVGFPGIVSDGVVLGGADNFVGFHHIPLADLLAEQTGISNIILDNDANMMGWGEVMYGSADHLSDAIFLTVGTGIGGAMVINGRLYGGYQNRGAELGHMIIRHGGLTCSCGAAGCLEAYASVTALINAYRQLNTSEPAIDGEMIIKRYLAGEQAAITAMNWHFEHLSAGIASLIHMFSPQRILIGGGIAEAGDFYIRSVEKRVRSMVMKEASAHTSIQAARLGNRAGYMGCIGRVLSKK